MAVGALKEKVDKALANFSGSFQSSYLVLLKSKSIIDASVISIFDALFRHLKGCFVVAKLTFDAGVIIELF